MRDVRFSILGPIRAWRGETELGLGAARQPRLILALLVARAASGAGASLTELVDLLWPADPPASAMNVVHRHVGALRRILEPGLPTRATGSYLLRDGAEYRIRLDDDGLDLVLFRRLAARARDASDPDAVDLFRQALGLWQDRCAAELRAGGPVHPDFTAIDGEGFAVVRDAADAALRCGRAGAIEEAVRCCATMEPLDEALQARLLLVLAATGRQAEALSRYADVRRRLADELGIQPGPELREAYARLLSQDVPPKPAGPRNTPVPSQLPPDHPHFVGRRDDLNRAMRLLADDRRAGRPTRALVIDGMPGVGKTTMAVHLAHDLAPCYPDGCLYADLRGFAAEENVMSPGEALRGFLWSLGVAPAAIPAELHAQAGLLRSILADRKVLILLDNCRDWEQVRHLLPGTGESLVITTSRRSITGMLATAGAHALSLEPLPAGEARELLAQRLGEDRTAAEPQAIDKIIERCGRLPLALALVATRSAIHPELRLGPIADALEAASGRLDGFGDAVLDLNAIFSWSYHALSDRAARLFRLLPLHPDVEFGTPATAALAGLAPHAAAGLLSELRSHLLVQSIGDRWRMHDLLRGYATELGEEHDGPDARRTAEHRLLAYFHHTAYAGHLALHPQVPAPPPGPPPAGVTPGIFADQHEAMSWFLAEQHNVLATVDTAQAAGAGQPAWETALTVQTFLQYTGQIDAWAAAAEAGLAAAGDDPLGQALMRRSLAGVCYFRSDFTTGLEHLELAGAGFERLGRCDEQAHVENNIAEIRFDQERYADAIRHGRRALELFRSTGHRRGQGGALMVIAKSTLTDGSPVEALAMFGEAGLLYESANDLHGVGTALAWSGEAYGRLHDDDRRLASLYQGVAAFRLAESPMNAAETLTLIGDALWADGQPEHARRLWREALSDIDRADPALARRITERIQHGPALISAG
ncbi:BTAD domain-containing putative transcriptional regulator [Actinoplanes sp. NBRC 103695]|uniref:AfsR/SARP family transcriptional regulator n=1 Tax=Actinoplanes sp. NBRC 103695 TaxID=3032202 RepID=UPI0024A0D5AA|nr:BTAD domain-containing putative transcriptional regulator [Actinoplanes sp. NBRC 103695]GLY98417.1 SARP family transcriptional regulator [Actinoplanes sp. NBRC 103695]